MGSLLEGGESTSESAASSSNPSCTATAARVTDDSFRDVLGVRSTISCDEVGVVLSNPA